MAVGFAIGAVAFAIFVSASLTSPQVTNYGAASAVALLIEALGVTLLGLGWLVPRIRWARAHTTATHPLSWGAELVALLGVGFVALTLGVVGVLGVLQLVGVVGPLPGWTFTLEMLAVPVGLVLGGVGWYLCGVRDHTE